MRTVRVTTNETCDVECRGCHVRAPAERTSVAGGQSIREALRRAQGAKEIVLAGGEPTLRKDLAGIVGFARRQGDASIVLETHGLGLSETRLRELSSAGLSTVRLLLPAAGPDLDEALQRRGAWEATVATARAARAVGLRLEAVTGIDEDASFAEIPRALADRGLDVARWWLRRPAAAELSLDRFAARVAECAESARRSGITVQLDGSRHVPPCAFERPLRVAHLYALNPGAAQRPDHRRIPACGECLVADRCPGVHRDDEAPSLSRPLRQAAQRRRLTVISTVEEQIQRELVTRETYRRDDGSTIPAAIVRVNFHCNQGCDFCFVSTHLPPPDRRDVEREIREIGGVGGIIAFSGGEPTLSSDLEDLVALAKEAGVREVELQTNATRMADDDRAARLEAAGVDVAFVSLHGATAAVSDRVTGAPGTHVRTLAGLDALARTAIRTRINFVLCGYNHYEFSPFIDLVSQRWPKASVNVSFVAPSTDLVPRHRDLIVRYADVMPSLKAGLQRGRETGVTIGGFESMCGIPLCLVPDDLQGFFRLAPIESGYDGGEFLKANACVECVLEPRCFGLRRGYAELHGTEELRAIIPPPPTD